MIRTTRRTDDAELDETSGAHVSCSITLPLFITKVTCLSARISSRDIAEIFIFVFLNLLRLHGRTDPEQEDTTWPRFSHSISWLLKDRSEPESMIRRVGE